ncbi:hypothetical protein [Nocardioides sp. YIM 152315]|uniref:hypothetical protein n=1 Tax=Nocardioides sp. YIM 152315 TaxID=3031760 RepID=UPI0023DB6EE1|nr:hypothetical protein [Nocardioides sp. YIM 152315]MDF1605987.1 hypothetical protein [Nocardioides sp. YIM 152315]
MRVRRTVQVVLVVVVLGLVGAAMAAGISASLGIRTEAKDVPVEDLRVAPPRDATPPLVFTRIAAPDTLRTRTAVAELRDAVSDAEGTRGSATLVVRHGHGDPDDDTYRLGGTRRALRITAASETGAVRGVYDLALAARERRPLTERLGQTVTSRLPFRMVDLGAAGVDADPEQWRGGEDYSHYSRAFEDAILPEAPYVDRAALPEARASVLSFVRHELAEGYNAIAVPGFLEYLTFADVPEVYADDPEYVARAEAMRAAFGPIWREVHDLGMQVYLRTDMLVLSGPLEQHLRDEFDLDTTDDALWDVYEKGLDELYREMPYLAGVVLRIGEGGSIYNLPGWDYYSEITVTTAPAVRAMLTAFTDEAERSDTTVVFRTWSVGVGAVGDMHTNPDSYHEVLDGLDSPNLVVSTKYSLGDFYSWLPLNDTLETGDQRRIVELQSRREFEAFGAIPNDLGTLTRQALQRFLAANPHVEGIWTWTQDGGPWRAGPMTLQLTHGFWQLYDLNTEVAARLARDPDADPAELTADWARRWFSTDPATVAAITTAMASSREAVTQGLYIEPFAQVRAFALGLEPPPQMWIFEWDILTGDSAVLDVIYSIVRDSGPTGVDDAIAAGDRAVDTADEMFGLVADTDPATWRDPALRQEFLDALDYQVDLFQMLAAYRAMVLRHAHWLDTGEGREEWAQARSRFDATADLHEQVYGDDLELPAYNLTAARIGEERADRDVEMAWLARGGLLALLLALGLTRTGRTMVRSALAPWREPGPVSWWLVAAIPLLAVVWSRLVLTWFLAPAHLLLVGIGWAVLAGVVLATRSWWVATAVGGAVTLRTLLLLAVLSVRGPGGYWFVFWTEPGWRTAYVVVSFVLFGWVLACLAWALAGATGRRRAGATVLGVVGATLLGVGALTAAVGLEDALAVWNDQLALLPWGMARILGITTFLGIPEALPWWLLGAGAVLLLGALAFGLPRRRLRAPAAP